MAKLLEGDSREVMSTLQSSSIDTIITDPPYGLSFMGKKWDYDVPSVETFQEMLKVIKPGGTLLCFAGSRTQHRMAVNIEDAGWILKDCIMWLYGSGFPKATDISKQLDKGNKGKVIGEKRFGKTSRGQGSGWNLNAVAQTGRQEIREFVSDEAKLWNGWKSHGLKPAYEPIIVAMKPNEGTYAANALKHGVSGLNIDGGRIGTEVRKTKGAGGTESTMQKGAWGNGKGKDLEFEAEGRFPANIILETSYIQVLTLIDRNEIIESYYENYKLPSMLERVSDISEQDGEVLQSKMLQQIPERKSSESNEREKTQQRSNNEDETTKGAKQEVSGLVLQQGVQISESRGIDTTTTKNSETNDDKKSITRTQNHNGTSSKQAFEDTRGGTSQERNQGRQQNGELGDDGQLNPQNGTQNGVKGVTTIEVLARDVPEAWLRYFRPTGYSVINPECSSKMLDEQSGESKSVSGGRSTGRNFGGLGEKDRARVGHSDKGGASRFFYCAKASKAERNKGLDCYLTVKYNECISNNKNLCKEENMVAVQLLEKVTSDTEVVSFSTGECGENIMVQCHKDFLSTILTEINRIIESKTYNSLMHSLTSESTVDVNSETESGGNHAENVADLRRWLLTITKGNQELALGASRVVLKMLSLISEEENWKPATNFHSTVKPLKLMEYLCTLTKTPTGGIVLDPFMGSGTTGLACQNTGREFIGIEREKDYIEITKARLEANQKLV